MKNQALKMPVSFVIFGITGDLAENKLIPALFNLFRYGKLPKKFQIIGYSRRPIERPEFLAYLEKSLEKLKPSKTDLSQFFSHINYIQGHFELLSDYRRLGEHLLKIDDEIFRECSNKLFYLAVPPVWYETIAKNLSHSGLTIPCGGRLGWTRVLIEKPFGHDFKTSRKLNLVLSRLFKEDQIFRIDHYLGKGTSEEILKFRFTGNAREKIWNDRNIEKIKIQLLERKGVNDRGAFYDEIGALRDVGQNHLLQMLALIVMKKPSKMVAKEIRKARAEILEKLQPISKKDLENRVIKGQYIGYLKERGVKTDSKTETFFHLDVKLDKAHWNKTKFILEAGKALNEDSVGIKVYFKDKKSSLTFNYNKSVGKTPEAYEKVLMDCVLGDQAIFNSTAEVEAAWRFITPILENWKKLPLVPYTRGSRPEEISSKLPLPS